MVANQSKAFLRRAMTSQLLLKLKFGVFLGGFFCVLLMLIQKQGALVQAVKQHFVIMQFN